MRVTAQRFEELIKSGSGASFRTDGERALAWLDVAAAAEDAVEREMAQMAATRHTLRSLSGVRS